MIKFTQPLDYIGIKSIAQRKCFLISLLFFILSSYTHTHASELTFPSTFNETTKQLKPQLITVTDFLNDSTNYKTNTPLDNKIYQVNPTNTDWENMNPVFNFDKNPYKVSLFSQQNGEDGARLWSQTKSIFVYGFGVIGVIALLPENISNWDSDNGIYNKWTDNVKVGPVWDRDSFGINVIGHGYFGGVFYQSARKSGYRQWDAFLYSTLMSTFYWEYGIEAFAEKPSIQDLVVTPVIGWAYGEWAYTTEMDIRSQGGKVFGSNFLGDLVLIILDPVDSAGVGINRFFGLEIIKAGTGSIDLKDTYTGLSNQKENHIQLAVSFQLGSGGRLSTNSHKKFKKIKDPVDTGIIGFSYGTGKLSLDKKWFLSNELFTEYSLGLYFSRNFSTRLSYASATLTDQFTNKRITYENYNISGQYYFNAKKKLRPYITTGFGETMLEEDYEKKTFQLNAGLGLYYKLTNNFAIQADWRHFYSSKLDNNDDLFGASIIYRFGKGER